MRKVRRAASIAVFNAWSFVVAAVASLLLLVGATIEGHFTIAAAGITAALGVIAYFEFRGQRMLNELNPVGCRLLGWNQIALLAAITAYCVWSIIWGFIYPSQLSELLAEHPEVLAPYSEADRRDVEDIFVMLDDFWPAIIASIYGGVSIATVIYQGGNAWYYFARGKFVRECRDLLDQHAKQSEER